MVELDNIKTELQTLSAPLKEIEASLSLDDKKNRVEELERLMEEPNFWDDTERSQKYMKELKSLKNAIETVDDLNRRYEDIETLLEMGLSERQSGTSRHGDGL